MNSKEDIKKHFNSFRNVLYNFKGQEIVDYFPLGKLRYALNSKFIMLEEGINKFHIGIVLSNLTDEVIDELYEKIKTFGYNTEKKNANTIYLEFDNPNTDGKESIPIYLHFSLSREFLEWVYHYGFESEYTYYDRVLILKSICEYFPIEIKKWNSRKHYVIDTYTKIDVDLNYGLYNKIYSFIGRNGYYKKAEQKDKMLVSKNPKDILRYILRATNIENFNTVEKILTYIQESEFHLEERKDKILERFEYLKETNDD